MDRLSRQILLAEAGEASYEKGRRMTRSVRGLRISGQRAEAYVKGTELYRVSLDWSGEEVDGECTCPHFASGYFCKHLVAVGMETLQDDSPSSPEEAPVSAAQLVAELSEETVRRLLATLVESDPTVERLVEAHAGHTEGLSESLLDAARGALRFYGFVDYRESATVAHTAAELLDELEQHVAAGSPDVARPALFHAVKRLRKIIEQADDSSGSIGDQCQRALDLYARSCREGTPDPVKLAKWLVKFRTDSPGWPDATLDDFSPALDERGLAAYRRAVKKLDEERAGEDMWSRFELNRMLLELADYDGDVDQAVRILTRDPESPQYGAVIDRLTAAGREAEVMRWVDKAVDEGRVSGMSNEYWLAAPDVAEMYREDGREEEGLDVLQKRFVKAPGWETYAALTTFAEKLDIAQRQSTWALNRVHEIAAENPPYGQALVEIALKIDDVELAWDAAAQYGPGRWWQELARRSAETRPLDAGNLYRREIDRLVPQTQTGSYPVIAKCLVVMREFYMMAGREPEFQAYLDDILERYGNRPRMLKDFATAGVIEPRPPRQR